MKIAYVIGSLGLVSETFVADLIGGLSLREGELMIVCNDRPADLHLFPYQIHTAKFLYLSSLFDRLSYRFDYLWDTQQPVRTFTRQLNCATKALIPVLTQERPDVIYVDFGTVAVFTRSACNALQIPFVVHFHGADITSAINNPAYRAELHRVFVDATALIVASHHIRRLLILEGAPASKIQVIRLGINLEGVIPWDWPQRQASNPSVIFMGRFTPKKHPIALIEAFALVKQQVPAATLTMIGDGPELPRAKERIQRLQLTDSVRLCGALPRSEALPIVNQHWVYAQHSVTAPSGDQEGFGISLAEAAMLELPVVSTVHNGIPEQVIDGKTGFLVKEFDYETMAAKIIELLLNPDLAAQMGRAGRQWVGELCQTDNRSNRIYELLIAACKSDIRA
jgi:colanic acid/amylovoran biosynthesis glycosyltransferase